MLNEEFISQKNDEEFIIHRKLKGKDIIFGTYSTLNDALKARDKLDDDGWPIPVQNQNINTFKSVNDIDEPKKLVSVPKGKIENIKIAEKNNEPEKNSTSKLTNNSSLVIFDKLHEKWRIQLKNGDKKYFVGSYDSENEAKKAENDYFNIKNNSNKIQSDNNSDNKSIVSEKNLNENNNAKEIISYNSEIEKYLAYFEFEKREIYLGQYNTADEAQNGINIYKKIINSKIKLNGKIKYNQRTGKFYSYNLNRNEYIGNYINILEAKKAINHYISKSDEKINEEIDTTQVLNDKYISFNNGFYIISKYIKSENVLFDAFLLKEDAEKKINHLIRRKWKIDKNKKLGNNILYNGQKYILYNIVHNEIKVYGLYSDLEEAMDYKEFLINNNWKQTIKRNKEYNKSKLNKTTKNQINKLKKENKSLKKEIQSINSNKIDERKIQNTLEKVKSSYIKIVNDKNIKLQNSNKEIHILKKENESLKKANKKLSNESYFTSKKMEQLNEEINLINNELKNLELNYSKIINNLKNENKILNNEKIKLQVDNQKLIKKYNKDNLKDTTKLKTKTPEEIKENKFLKYKSSALQLYKNPKNIECLKCGFKNPVSVKYCISCGSNLANQKQ